MKVKFQKRKSTRGSDDTRVLFTKEKRGCSGKTEQLLYNYAFFFPETALMTNRVPIIRAMEIGRTMYHLGIKPAKM